MKTGLVMEGGAMRGMFTAGVTDVLMENGITFDGAVGVSAGAVFGCNYKSKQIGRTIRYNKKFCRDPRFVSFRSLLKTGNLYGTDFAYHKIPQELDKFDTETFTLNPMEFYVVCTNVETGKPLYHRCTDGLGRDLLYMRASASLPLVSELVKVDGYTLSDGGAADSIPLQFFEEAGYEKNVVILTQPAGYVKEQNKALPLLRLVYRKWPAFIDALANRHLAYNETLSYIEKREQEGAAFVIRPPEALKIKHVEKNPEALVRVYQIGRQTGEAVLEELIDFLKQ